MAISTVEMQIPSTVTATLNQTEIKPNSNAMEKLVLLTRDHLKWIPQINHHIGISKDKSTEPQLSIEKSTEPQQIHIKYVYLTHHSNLKQTLGYLLDHIVF